MSAGQLVRCLDFSTQQLKAVVMSSSLDITAEESVHFDSELPEFLVPSFYSHTTKRCIIGWVIQCLRLSYIAEFTTFKPWHHNK